MVSSACRAPVSWSRGRACVFSAGGRVQRLVLVPPNLGRFRDGSESSPSWLTAFNPPSTLASGNRNQVLPCTFYSTLPGAMNPGTSGMQVVRREKNKYDFPCAHRPFLALPPHLG